MLDVLKIFWSIYFNSLLIIILPWNSYQIVDPVKWQHIPRELSRYWLLKKAWDNFCQDCFVYYTVIDKENNYKACKAFSLEKNKNPSDILLKTLNLGTI